MWLWSNVDLHRCRTVSGGVVLSQFAASRYWHADGELTEPLQLFLTDQEGPVAGVVGIDDFHALLSGAHRLQRRKRRARQTTGHAQR